MALATNITRRAGSKNYYARITVPQDLKQKFGKGEVWKSLKTSDPAEAKRRARPIIEQYDREFARLPELTLRPLRRIRFGRMRGISSFVQSTTDRGSKPGAEAAEITSRNM